jgi:hypothetical protein
MHDIQWRRFVEDRVWRKLQAFDAADRRCGLAVNAIGRIRDARQHLEWSCQVDLIDALEQEGADMQMRFMRDHGPLQVRSQWWTRQN